MSARAFIVTYALQPTLVYSAFVKPPSQREFEMMVLSKKDVDLDQLETFAEKLKMSICVIPFGKYMSPDMLESMNRLHYRGQMKIGNFQTATAERVRRCFYYHMNKKRKEAREREVLSATGYAFTPANMILVANLLRQERIENEARRVEREGRTLLVMPLIHDWHSTPATATRTLCCGTGRTRRAGATSFRGCTSRSRATAWACTSRWTKKRGRKNTT